MINANRERIMKALNFPKLDRVSHFDDYLTGLQQSGKWIHCKDHVSQQVFLLISLEKRGK